MSINRVVITGRGAVSPFGIGVSKLLDEVWAGRSAIRYTPILLTMSSGQLLIAFNRYRVAIRCRRTGAF